MKTTSDAVKLDLKVKLKVRYVALCAISPEKSCSNVRDRRGPVPRQRLLILLVGHYHNSELRYNVIVELTA